jgi:transcriptional antiterminator RfaH
VNKSVHGNERENTGMNFSDPRWFAIHAKHCLEEVALGKVRSLGCEVLLPRVQEDKARLSKRHTVIKPLFPGYLFAKFVPAIHLHAIRYSRGVLRVVGAADKPLPVDEKIIEEIKSRIQKNGFVYVGPKPLRPGDSVLVREGPFEGFMGFVERESNARSRVLILLNTLGQARISIERRCLEPVAN